MTTGDTGSGSARRAPRAESAIPGLPPWADEDTPVFVISIAAEFSGMHAQTLRSYDRIGLVSPGRASGGGRRYSVRDIALLREVQRLSQEEGVNLAGIKRIIELEREVDQLTDRLAEVTDELARSRSRLQALAEQAGRSGDLLPVRRTQSVVVWQPAHHRHQGRQAPDEPGQD
ncbi:helix-turn-helix transcriptional regulator [Actinomycetospora corticicola]|uniref:MerR family transcriptional regulator/heat shock protein HspR n=1 Tax=Actinomycetospora corticicola TaxID=663602 RepID=A0A7Y9J796_9PSEU|nr:helix-turn-helix transcriptional regulator [Actinomycetospora corticicola]NYD38125.1 MerR family transcriptional regulator/heat shock protein HspR [Actinomycetospora corticicola]